MSAVISPKLPPPIDVDTIVMALKEILVSELNVAVPLDRIDENASLRDLNMDSVAMIELISAVEMRFGFTFLDSDLVSSSFANLRALSEVIVKRVTTTSL